MRSKFLNILEERGFVQDCTDMGGLDEYLYDCEQNNEPAIAYIGFDCTAESLHVGSLLQIMALRWFQKCGHKPIVLLGGATTKIGDPSGKDESRKMLSEEQIQKNKDGIRKVFEKFVTFDNSPTGAKMVDNDEWLANKGYIDFLREVGPHFSINRMLSFESVKRRLDREQTLSFLEFNYMILQAYDFVELAEKENCRIQIGGSDQWGNIVNGTELARRLGKANNLFGLTTPLLTTASGAKMGKTADGAIWLDDKFLSPYDFWQYWRNVEDADVVRFFKYFTDVELADIPNIEGVDGRTINEAKIKLANIITSQAHSEDAAKDAEETARKVFEQGGVGDDLPTIQVSSSELSAGIAAQELFVKSGLCESNGEVKRLVKGGGAKINDEKLSNHAEIINLNNVQDNKIKLSAGKKKHAVVEVA